MDFFRYSTGSELETHIPITVRCQLYYKKLREEHWRLQRDILFTLYTNPQIIHSRQNCKYCLINSSLRNQLTKIRMSQYLKKQYRPASYQIKPIHKIKFLQFLTLTLVTQKLLLSLILLLSTISLWVNKNQKYWNCTLHYEPLFGVIGLRK